MPVHIVAEGTFTVGDPVTVEGGSPSQPFGVFFEDDGATGYLYGVDINKEGNPIVDALHIYNVENVVDRERPSLLRLVWSNDGLKAAMFLNDYLHAVFDFEAKRGYCRTGFPPPIGNWSSQGHEWSDEVQELFR
jgi:hypothetical protein